MLRTVLETLYIGKPVYARWHLECLDWTLTRDVNRKPEKVATFQKTDLLVWMLLAGLPTFRTLDEQGIVFCSLFHPNWLASSCLGAGARAIRSRARWT